MRGGGGCRGATGAVWRLGVGCPAEAIGNRVRSARCVRASPLLQILQQLVCVREHLHASCFEVALGLPLSALPCFRPPPALIGINETCADGNISFRRREAL